MTDVSKMSDLELEQKYDRVSKRLDGGHTYWYAEEAQRDHRLWQALKNEIKARNCDNPNNP